MKRYMVLIANAFAPIILVLLIALLLPKVLMFFAPFVIGIVIAFIANPLIKFLNQKTHIMQRQHASLFVIMVILVLIGGGLYLIITEAIRILIDFSTMIPGYFRSIMDTVNGYVSGDSQVLTKLPPQVTLYLKDFINNINSYLGDVVTSISTPAFTASIGAVKSLPVLLVYIVVTVFSSYCFLMDGEKYVDNIKTMLPINFSHYTDLMKADIKKIFHGWLLAQVKIIFFVFATLCIGFIILKIKYAPLIAFIIAFLDFLPMLGVGFVMWPWIALTIIGGEFMKALWLSVIYIMTQIVRQFMQPKIMGDTLGLSGFLSILFLYLGFKFYGLAGMIFAIPVGMFFVSLYRYGAFDKMIAAWKELIHDLASFL